MKEIKFRAWDGVGMNYGGFSVHATGKLMVDPVAGWIPDDAVVMQYTGLQDRNGMDIYEGDILSDKWKAVVYFKNGSFWVTSDIWNNADTYLYGFIKSRQQAKCPFEVIGNIHQNPDLLEQRND